MNSAVIIGLVVFVSAGAALATLAWRAVSAGMTIKAPAWTSRDIRKLLAMFLLSGGGVAMTVVVWRLIGLVAERSLNDPWALAYSLYGQQALIALVFVSLGWVIGKMKGDAEAPGGIKLGVSGGEDDEPPTPQGTATLTASMTVPASPPAQE